jgi:hypothetical protein
MFNQNHSSDFQLQIENIIRNEISKSLNKELDFGKILKTENFHVDFFTKEFDLIGEIYVFEGILKSGQKRKVASDILKLITIKKILNRNDVECKMLITDESAVTYFSTKSWISKTIKEFNIKLEFFKLDSEKVIELQTIRKRQKGSIV